MIDTTKLHSTTQTAGDVGADITADSAQTPASASSGDFCAANHYGTAASFDGTGCTACPANSEVAAAAGGGLATCLTKAGHWLQTAHATDPTQVVVTAISIGDGFYATGQVAVTNTAAEFDGLSAAFLAGTAAPTAGDTAILTANGAADCPTATTNLAVAPSSASDCNKILCADIPLSSSDDTTGGAVEASSAPATQTGTSTFAICETAPGYYLHTKASAASAAAGIVIEKAPAGWFATGGEDVSASTNVLAVAAASLDNTASGAGTTAYDNAKIFYCATEFTNAIANSFESAAGASDCKTKPGYYVSVAATGASALDATTAQAPAGKYIAGGTMLTGASVETPSSCPANANSPAGSDALADCSCNTGYTLSGSTCVASTPTASTPTAADSAGAAMPIAAAVAAMAMPLLI